MKGHLSKACGTGAKRGFPLTRMVTPRNRSHPKNYNLEETDNIASDDENSVYYVHKIHHVNRLKVHMNLKKFTENESDNKNINFVVDTGSGIMVISEITYQEKLSNYDFTNLKIAIKTYANESLNVLGKLSVTVQCKENMFTNLPLYVIAGDDLQSGKWPDKISDDIKPDYNERNELTIEDGVILWGLRVIVPEQPRNKVLKELHQNHPGI